MLFEVNRVVDTIIDVLESQRPYFDTLVARYYEDRYLTIFKGQRASIPLSDIPSIEVYPQSSNLGKFACRTFEENFVLGIDLTIDESRPDKAVDLEGKLTTLVARILSRPPNIRTAIQGTANTLYDSMPDSVQYGGIASSGGGVIRIARMGWSGKALEFLSNSLFLSPRLGPEGGHVC